jgi:hypothetical protein
MHTSTSKFIICLSSMLLGVSAYAQDFTVSVDTSAKTATVNGVAGDQSLKYKLITAETNAESALKDVPTSLTIDLSDEAQAGVAYYLVVSSYDSNGTEQASARTRYKTPGDLTGWQYIGTSTVIDGSVLPLYLDDGDSPENYPFEVATYTNDRHDVVALFNPFIGTTFPKYSEDVFADDNLIEFDVSDPECVVLMEQSSHLYSDSFGIPTVMNYEGFYMGYYNTDKASVKSILQSRNTSSTLGDDNVINIPIAIVGFGGKSYPFFPASVALPKDFTAASSLTTDVDNNAPAEYFNLNGVRIDNPTAPGLYIRRQGNKASKVIVK